jgi:hypothetical protein
MTLKAFLDKLAGPDHPFCKGAPVNEMNNSPVKAGEEPPKTDELMTDLKLNKFLRTNSN